MYFWQYVKLCNSFRPIFVREVCSPEVCLFVFGVLYKKEVSINVIPFAFCNRDTMQLASGWRFDPCHSLLLTLP